MPDRPMLPLTSNEEHPQTTWKAGEEALVMEKLPVRPKSPARVVAVREAAVSGSLRLIQMLTLAAVLYKVHKREHCGGKTSTSRATPRRSNFDDVPKLLF